MSLLASLQRPPKRSTVPRSTPTRAGGRHPKKSEEKRALCCSFAPRVCNPHIVERIHTECSRGAEGRREADTVREPDASAAGERADRARASRYYSDAMIVCEAGSWELTESSSARSNSQCIYLSVQFSLRTQKEHHLLLLVLAPRACVSHEQVASRVPRDSSRGCEPIAVAVAEPGGAGSSNHRRHCAGPCDPTDHVIRPVRSHDIAACCVKPDGRDHPETRRRPASVQIALRAEQDVGPEEVRVPRTPCCG